MLPEPEQQERALLADCEVLLARTVSAATSHATIRADWPNYLLAKKRALIEEALSAVVYPANGRRGFHPQRIELVWRELDFCTFGASGDVAAGRVVTCGLGASC
ncbi:MAG: hypothetical protein ACRDQ5_22570 [Sciscionella sp.]